MPEVMISLYSQADNESALRLEELCTQGTTIPLRYRRPTFHARSEVYPSYRILCGKLGGEN
jgi:hypothetical protein